MYLLCSSIVTLMLLFAQTEKEQIINNYFTALENYKYFKYHAITGYIDASKGEHLFEADCIFKQVPEDTVMGAYYFVKSDNDYRVWNGLEFLEYNQEYFKDKHALCQNIKKNPKKFSEEVLEMDGKKFYAMAAVKNNFFLFSSPIELKKTLSEIKDSTVCTILNDSIINNIKCKGLSFKKSYSENDFVRYVFYFSTESHMPVYYNKLTVLESQNYSMEEKTYYQNYSFTKMDDSKVFSKKSFPKGLKYFSEAHYKERSFLKTGEAAPEWTLQSIENKTFSLNELKGKPAFLIFSEIGCVPCQLSIPKIKDIIREFPEISVLSIYPVDKKESLIKYAKKEEINYTILCNAKETGKKYLVNGYPAFFLINSVGILSYSSSGYGETSYKKWTEEIKKLLKK